MTVSPFFKQYRRKPARGLPSTQRPSFCVSSMKGLTGKNGTRQTADVLGWVSDFYEAETALPNESRVCY